MQIVAKEKSLGISTTRNLDTTVILHHAKRIVQKNEYLGKPFLWATSYLLLT